MPAVWIEQTTYRLQGGCSTAELSRHCRHQIAEPQRRFNPPARSDLYPLHSFVPGPGPGIHEIALAITIALECRLAAMRDEFHQLRGLAARV